MINNPAENIGTGNGVTGTSPLLLLLFLTTPSGALAATSLPSPLLTSVTWLTIQKCLHLVVVKLTMVTQHLLQPQPCSQFPSVKSFSKFHCLTNKKRIKQNRKSFEQEDIFWEQTSDQMTCLQSAWELSSISNVCSPNSLAYEIRKHLTFALFKALSTFSKAVDDSKTLTGLVTAWLMLEVTNVCSICNFFFSSSTPSIYRAPCSAPWRSDGIAEWFLLTPWPLIGQRKELNRTE